MFVCILFFFFLFLPKVAYQGQANRIMYNVTRIRSLDCHKQLFLLEQSAGIRLMFKAKNQICEYFQKIQSYHFLGRLNLNHCIIGSTLLFYHIGYES